MHPHPELANKIHISMNEPLAGVVLISPWVKFAADDESVKRNAYSDMITPQAADRWSSQFLGQPCILFNRWPGQRANTLTGSSPLDMYNQPFMADLSWFSGLDLRVNEILVWGGGKEVLVDSIEAIGKKLQEALSRTEVVIQPEAAHDDFILEKLLGYSKKAEGTKVVESWIADRL